MVGWFYGLPMAVLYLVTIVLIAGASELGNWLGRRSRGSTGSEFGTSNGVALGLLTLLHPEIRGPAESALAAGRRDDGGGAIVPAGMPLRRFVKRDEQYR